MPDPFSDILSHAWSVFRPRNEPMPSDVQFGSYTHESSGRRERSFISITNERTILASIMSRIAIDVAAVDLRHVRQNTNSQFVEHIRSYLNDCLTIEANADQTGRALILDAVFSMFDEGVVAIVPVETTLNPHVSGGWDVSNLRTAKILGWMPEHVRIRIYNEKTGLYEELIVPKKQVAIIENPLYQVMNTQNSTLKRLAVKLSQLDAADSKATSGKLDIIIQLPYAIRSDLQKAKADERKKALEKQLEDSTHGIGYVDASEKITQLNRPAENQYVAQIELLTKQLFMQLGLTESILAGTAAEAEMLNYYNRTVEPILTAFIEEFSRKFLTKTARTQGQTIMFLRDPFKLVPISQIAEIADKFTRNEIMTSNEFRAVISLMPSEDPSANELRNKNIAQGTPPGTIVETEEDIENKKEL